LGLPIAIWITSRKATFPRESYGLLVLLAHKNAKRKAIAGIPIRSIQAGAAIVNAIVNRKNIHNKLKF
jgi:hypothetical protein